MSRPASLVAAVLVLLAGAAVRAVPFVDVTETAGITFVHGNGATGDKHLPETMGSGLAFFDADADGYLDLYFVNSVGAAAFYHNTGAGDFADKTATAGLGDSGYGMGVLAADLDGDGDQDLYVTAYGPNLLYRNAGAARFVDDTAAAGVADAGFGAGAAAADYDNDGDLDFFVANYLTYVPEENPYCARVQGVRVYCGPEAYKPQADLLYKNDGQGRFTNVAAAAGLLPAAAKELGAVFTDFDGDGDQDLYVAGDKTPNLLYRNNGDGSFAEIGMLANVAYGESGGALAGMGIAVGDIEGDGRFDYFVTNYQWEANSLYRSLAPGLFADDSFAVGVAVPSLATMGWGTALFDYDNDGDDDLFTANGHMDAAFEAQDNVRYAQGNQLFRNDGAVFTEITASGGPGMTAAHVSRGAAVADYDNDGDMDLAVANNGGPGVLLRNDGTGTGNWLTVVTRGGSGAEVVGTRVELVIGDRQQADEVRRGSSYLSSEDPRLHFGVGASKIVDVVRVRWPDGTQQAQENVPVNQFLRLTPPTAP